jgi:sugar phosphate isomerase/epimerase
MNRRNFLYRTWALGTAASAGAGLPDSVQSASGGVARKFTIDLTPGAIGVQADPRAVIDLAKKHGFESVQPNGGFLASLDPAGRKELAAKLKEMGLAWGAAGLPVDFRGDGETFQKGMDTLEEQAAALRDAGVTRVGTWLKPFHDSLTYRTNFRQHVDRLGRVTALLADHGIRFGLEYVGTNTLWTSKRYSFIHTMAETKELIAEIDQPTLGLVLDSWHWFTAGETAADILTLKNEDVVACDLNDAPAGIPIEEQIDGQRELPAATGVIDIAAFLGAVAGIGYDGPVRAEPFNQPLRQMDDGPAAAATAKAIRKAIEIARL